MSSSEKKETSGKRVQRRYSRCPVVPEESHAWLHVGRKRFPAAIHDRSIEGFSIFMKSRDAKRLQLGEVWILKTATEKARVTAQWMAPDPSGTVQFGLRRVPATYSNHVSGMFPVWLGKHRRTMNPDLLVAGFVLVAVLVLSLPGIGERVGMPEWIQAGIQRFGAALRTTIANIW